MQRDALFSSCGTYRYRLGRRWDGARAPLAVVMLNPSTADAARDDPTIRRCTAFAARDGYGGIEILNLFAFRATAPAMLKAAADPIGPDNDRHLQALFGRHRVVLVAWGVHGNFGARAEAVLRIAAASKAALICLGRTAGGQPRHPLYVRADSRLLPFG